MLAGYEGGDTDQRLLAALLRDMAALSAAAPGQAATAT